MLRRDAGESRQCELRAEIEQLVLQARQALANLCRQRRLREHEPDGAVRLVYIAECLDALVAFVDALAVREARRAIVTGACVDFAESVAHRSSDPSLLVRSIIRFGGRSRQGFGHPISRAVAGPITTCRRLLGISACC